MPELPEVETIRRGIESWVVGQIIMRIEIRIDRLRWPIDNKIIAIQNQCILSIQRRAKYLLLELNKGWIIIHFGMSGSLRVLPISSPIKKHDYIDLVMSGYIIRYTDPRRFGAWLWSDNLIDSKVLANLGPEPLSNEFTGKWLYHKTRNKKRIIKSLLMDSMFVAGIGNIYANESLFFARIFPGKSAGLLNEEESKLLVNAIKRVLIKSIKIGGTTFRNFLQPNGNIGFYAQKLQVYNRAGKPCFICKTLIQIIKHNQRSTFFCPKCQH